MNSQIEITPMPISSAPVDILRPVASSLLSARSNWSWMRCSTRERLAPGPACAIVDTAMSTPLPLYQGV
jgi:hypothetical protein